MAGKVQAKSRPQQGGGEDGVLFLGTGSSAGTPLMRCVLQQGIDCKVCADALNAESKNHRGNPSIVVRHRGRHVLVDCGKTFSRGVVRHFPKHNITHLDAVVLTHGHADAIMGLDDMREIQLLREAPTHWNVESTMPLFANSQTLQGVGNQLGYVLERAGVKHASSVARLVPHEVHNTTPFEPVAGLVFTPLPVWHGKGYTSLGFAFGESQRVVYISDVSEVPAETLRTITALPVHLLVVDALTHNMPRWSHFHMGQSLELVRQVRPQRALFVGMSCNIDHESTNRTLAHLKATEGLDVQLAFDGLFEPLAL